MFSLSAREVLTERISAGVKMATFGTLVSLSEQFEGAVRLDASQCLNTRVESPACDACVQVCPVEAITLTGDMHNPVTLDSEACVRCGACVSACPTGAFTQPRLADEQSNVTRTLQNLEGAAVEITCPQHPGDDESVAPVDAVVDVGRCLGSVTVSTLLTWTKLLGKDIWLNDRLCASCPIGGVGGHISVLAGHANRFLEAWNREERVHLVSEINTDRKPHRVTFYDGQHPAYSRRDFFSALGKMALRTAGALIEESLPVPLADSDKPVSEERMRLRAVLESLGDPAVEQMDVSSMPFANVEVSDLCSGCEVCTRICPTDALTFETDGEYFVLNFLDADCLGCNLCATVCPEQAIHLERMVSPARLIEAEPRPVMSGKLVPCSVCGRPTRKRPDDEEPICYICRAKQ